MRRAVAFAFLLFVPTLVVAESTQRYVVALERGMPGILGARLLRDIDGSTPARDRRVQPFRVLEAFAADLTEEEAKQLRRAPGVRYVEAAVERHILGRSLNAATQAIRNLEGETIPEGLDAVHAREVWSVTRGEDVNVVVIDTGIDHFHGDLSGNFAGSFNAITGTPSALDDNDHGTHVAGTIAATDNNFGVVGVAPEAKLWAVKALAANGSGSSANVAAGIDWVVEQKRARGGNWIINMSLGSIAQNTFEGEAVAKAVAEGILIVAASGNESTLTVPKPVSYPAAYPGVIAVGAISSSGQLAGFSNQGPELAAVAPGVDVLSTVRRGGGVLTAVLTSGDDFLGSALQGSDLGTIKGEFVACGIGRPQDFPSTVAGRIAVVHRGGEIRFHEKARRAMAAGATAVVIINNNDEPLNFTLFDPEDSSTNSVDWPVVIAVSKDDGAELLKATGTITVANVNDDYDSFSGTSMASPHVAGVAALLWAVAPDATSAQIRNAITTRAQDLGPAGFDPAFGHGVVNALEAAKMLNPAAFGTPATPEPLPTRRRSVGRGN